MPLPRILVSGATGKTGLAVVRELVARRHPVRAAVRVDDARADALRAMGAEVVVADFFDPDQWLAALRGTNRVYFAPPFHPHALHGVAAFAIAAREADIESIVQLGQWLSHRAHPAVTTRQTWLTDRLLAQLPGIAHTIVAPGMFADNFLRTIDFAALLGIHPVLTGDGRAAPVSNEDIARTAVAVLLAPERHAGRTYRPTGPTLLSGREMAAVVERVVGHRVRPIHLPFWMFRKVARQQGIDPFEIGGFRHYVEDMKGGAFSFDGGVTSVVADLTGASAESFETIATRYAALPFARRTLGNRARALARMNLAMFRPGYDLDGLDRLWRIPVPPAPTASLDDARWRRERRATMQQMSRITSDAVLSPSPHDAGREAFAGVAT